MLIVLQQEPNGDHQVVDVVKDQCAFLGVGVLLVEECLWMVTPVTQWVEVVRGMVPIVEAVTVALSLTVSSMFTVSQLG
jgi:hypothetical protein